MRRFLVALGLFAAIAAAGAIPVPAAEHETSEAGPLAHGTGRGAVDPQIAVLRTLRRAATGPTNVSFVDGFPRFVQTSVRVPGRNPVKRARHFLEDYKGLYGQFMRSPFDRERLDPNRLPDADPGRALADYRRVLKGYRGEPTSSPDLDLAVRGTTGPGDQVVAFAQSYKGVPIFGADLLVFVRGKRVRGSVGGLLPDLELGVRPRLEPSEAEDAARRALDQPPASAPALARTHPVVFAPSLLGGQAPAAAAAEPTLAWQVALGGPEPTSALVDARSGQLLLSWPGIRSHNGLDDYDLDLEDANGNSSANSGCYWWTGDNDTLGDEDGLNDDGENDPQAVELWHLSRDAYRFFHNKFSRHSYDDDGGQFELYVHAGVDSAAWHGGPTDCDLIDFGSGFVAFDVLVHELTHGVAEFSLFGKPVYKNQSGALDESHADTIAARADGDWLLGEDTSGGAVRDMSDPPAFGDPDRMGEFDATSADNGGVHTNSGIPNKAAFLLAEGGIHPDTGLTVAGVGRPSMGWLTYMTTLMMPPTASFLDNRSQMLMHATLGSWSASARCSVINAYAAVEVGNPDIDCDGFEDDPDPDGDGFPFGQDNCPNTPNPSQKDTDDDGVGDICDGDPDEDGVFAPIDNCPNVANPDQTDANFNGIGEACDPSEDDDFDDDEIPNDDDNCILDANSDQADVDDDGYGDACDPDEDEDGTSNDDDNCPFTPNASQADSDGDGIGDACDGCPNTDDGLVAWTAGEPELGIDPMPMQPDSDGDGTPDACEGDITVNGGVVGIKNILKPGGGFREVDLAAVAGSVLKLAVSPTRRVGEGGWFKQDERRRVVLAGLDPQLKTWITDDEGRTVARPSARDAKRRTLTFRPLADHRYFLFFEFSALYEGERRQTLSAKVVPKTVRVRWPESPRPSETVTSTALDAKPMLLDVGPPLGVRFGVLRAVLSEAESGDPVPGKMVVFRSRGVELCQATTNAAGLAECRLRLDKALRAILGGRYTASFAGDEQFGESTETAGIL